MFNFKIQNSRQIQDGHKIAKADESKMADISKILLSVSAGRQLVGSEYSARTRASLAEQISVNFPGNLRLCLDVLPLVCHSGNCSQAETPGDTWRHLEM